MKPALLICGLVLGAASIGCGSRESATRKAQSAEARLPTVPDAVRVDSGSETIRPALVVEVASAGPIEFMSVPGADFLMSRFEVTREQWASVMGRDPSTYPGEGYPVHNVNWFEAVEFCRRVSALGGVRVQLPLADEWDHACRVGGSRGHAGVGRIRSVGSGIADENGICDMQENVEEWCLDHLVVPMENGLAAELEDRLVRGGSWIMPGKEDGCVALLSYTPSARGPWLGFRVVTGGDPEARDEVADSFAPRVIRRKPGERDVDTGVRMQPLDAGVPTGEVIGGSWWRYADQPPEEFRDRRKH